MPNLPDRPEEVSSGLIDVGYLPDDATALVAFLAIKLGKPILVEGPAGVGKTQLAKSLAETLGRELVRLQCYEGLDEAKALYEWNYRKQLLRIQAAQGTEGSDSWSELHDDIFSEEFLLARPLLTAIRQQGPTVLLVDETDKADVEVEGLLLEVLSEFQVTVPELGTIVATHRPFVVLTSNATRELSEALKRRCLYAHVDYPDAARELAIVMSRVPKVAEELAIELVRAVRAMRAIDLRKAPSVAETIDWARAMQALGVEELTDAVVDQTLGVVLKHEQDRQRVREQLGLGASQ